MENYKILNTKNILANIEKFKAKKICAMVKSDAYGHGMNEIVKIIEDNVDYFGVVSIREAVSVRKITDKPVLICSKVFDYKTCKNYDVDVMIDDEKDLLSAIENKNNIHLKINSGMNRFGIKGSVFMWQINKILEQKEVDVKYLHTHFRETDSKRQTHKDYEKFLQIKSNLTKKIPICFGGSGVAKYDFEYDMIRLGIAMYGYGKGMKPVEEIVSYVSKIFYASRGETIGYNRAYKVKIGGLFAVVPVGYGDGLRRCLSGKFYVKINGKEYKSVGNICMDAFFVKVDEYVQVGDEVVVMDNANDLSDGTINYEVLTDFSRFRGKIVVK